MDKIKNAIAIIFFLLLLILFSPVILALLLYAGISNLLTYPSRKQRYLKSQFYQDLQIPYVNGLEDRIAFRVYESAKEQGLDVSYGRRQIDDETIEYICYRDTLYLLPNFECLELDEHGIWQADEQPMEECFTELWQQFFKETETHGIKILLQRSSVFETDLTATPLPECIYLASTYETAFSSDAPVLKLPIDHHELYDLILQRNEIFVPVTLEDDHVHLSFGGGACADIYVDENDCVFSISVRTKEITHWHPTIYEVYDDVCQVGRKGNVLIVSSFLGGGALLYAGPKEDCPYRPNYKRPFQKIYYMDATETQNA